ncbi:MAG: CubicO group peptidase (beta-lactamase class C family) [Yoonia sp.]|jgi:CubicO group peptidase (beta-lactamase class C family)
MKLYFLLTSCIGLAACTMTGQEGISSAPESVANHPAAAVIQGLSTQRLNTIDDAMQRYIEADKIVGTVTLVARNNDIVHLSANGMKNRETSEVMTTDTIFRIYSMTKPITAVAALQLWEQGKFHMYDPIEKYLPELKDLSVYVSGSGETMVVEKAKSPIRIIDLFLHTAGFSYGFTNSEVDKLYKALPPLASNDTASTVLKRIAKLPLNHQPGTQWHYGVNTDVIGFLVERLSGMKLGEYMQKEIFAPLKMNDTAFYVSADKAARMAQIYGPNKDGKTIVYAAPLGDFLSEPAVHNGGGGLTSTINDYYIFTQMLLNGGQYNGSRILGTKAVEYLSSNHLPDKLMPFQASSPGEGYGLTMSVTVDHNEALIMGSTGDYGWGGAASTYFRIDPEENLIVIMMAQFLPSAYYPIRHDFKNTAYQALVE